MFRKTRKRIKDTVEAIQAAFRLFVATVQTLTTALDRFTAEATLLRAKLDVIGGDIKFLANAKKAEHIRTGQSPRADHKI
jgi:hypothetical protein